MGTTTHKFGSLTPINVTHGVSSTGMHKTMAKTFSDGEGNWCDNSTMHVQKGVDPKLFGRSSRSRASRSTLNKSVAVDHKTSAQRLEDYTVFDRSIEK